MKLKSKVLTTLILLLITACSQNPKKNTDNQQDEGRKVQYTNEVTFLNNNGKAVTTIDVAVAETEDQRNEGLMDVNSMPADKGMLFKFEREQPLSFWMANTPLPLDIIFVNADKTIVRIHHNAQPFSEKNLSSGHPAQFVVETNGGFCVSHDIQEGMKVKF